MLTNPVLWRMGLLLILVLCVLALGIWAMRSLRRNIASDADIQNQHPVPESNGMALATFQGVIQQLKQQEQELQRLRQAESEKATATRNLSAEILANLTSGVVLFNPSGLVQQANPAAKEILGYASPSGLQASKIFRQATVSTEVQQSAQDIPAAVDSALKRGQSFRRMEAPYVTPSGERRLLGVTISPVRSATGQILGAACLISDLTEITRLAEQVRLRESLSALGEMSAGIAHEFKNSLTTISGYAQMLTTEQDAGIARQFATKINNEVTNLSHVVNDFLDFARPHDLKTTVIDLAAMLLDCASGCNVELVLNLEPEAILIGDPTTLRQAFSNLIRNSAEAANDGRPVRIEISAQSCDDSVRILLHDNGKGIRPEDISRVFIPFFTTKAHGTGLGLALVHRIVAEHGGSVSVSSNDSGTAFTLLLPAGKVAVGAVEAR